MACYINGVRMATTNEEITCLFDMVKEVFAETGKKKTMNPFNPKEKKFAEIILEGRYQEIAIENFTHGEKATFSLTDVGQNEANTAFRIEGKVILAEKVSKAAFHMIAFTYNADGPLHPVGLSDTVYVENNQETLENVCFVRKALLDAWHLGIMMTLVIMNEESAEVISEIIVLNEKQNDFFERMKRA